MNIDLEQFESEVEDLEAGARKKKLEKEVGLDISLLFWL